MKSRINDWLRLILRIVPDKYYLQMIYYKHFHKFINFENPQTYNEKLQWLKINDRNNLYSLLVDKYRVKKYVADKIGEKYLIPTIGEWDNIEQIDLASLPNRFVLKWNHDSGSVFICKDKDNICIPEMKKILSKGASASGYWYGREWPYKNVPHKLIAEEYVEDDVTNALNDYKFFCFDGEPKMLFIATDRQNKNADTKFDFFDMEFNRLSIRNGHPNSMEEFTKPATFEEMKELARKLSAGFPQIRVDFYEVNGKVLFGELTLFHFSGFVPFEPNIWDEKMGSWINLKKYFGK